MIYACITLLTKNILKESKIWVAEGSLLDSGSSQCFDILSTNNSMKIVHNSKSLIGTSIETRDKAFNEENGSKNLVGLSL